MPEPVQVRHESERITWRVPKPYAPGRQGLQHTSGRTLSFDAAEYRQQAAELVQALRTAAADGGPLVRLACHPAELPGRVLQWIDIGGAGHGGRVELPG